MQALQGTDAKTSWCVTVEAKLVFRADMKKGCADGAYYLDDGTTSVFVCYPKASLADSSLGVVTCPDVVKAYPQDTSLRQSVVAEGLYFPAKQVCSQLLCKCQNGLGVDRLGKLGS